MAVSKKAILIICLGCVVVTGIVLRVFVLKGGDSLFMYAPSIKKVKLYFVNENGKLQAEKREIQGGSNIQEDVRICVEELAVGPKEKGLSRSIPAGATIRSIYIDDNRCMYLDFNKGFMEKQIGGTTGELQMIYSLVNTITENFGQINSVRILVEGLEVKSLGGHIDINGPLRSKKLE